MQLNAFEIASFKGLRMPSIKPRSEYVVLQIYSILCGILTCLNRCAYGDLCHSLRMHTPAFMADLIDIRLLIAISLEQVRLAQVLSPGLSRIDLLDRTAAAISTILPRLPDAVLEFAINEVGLQLNAAPV